MNAHSECYVAGTLAAMLRLSRLGGLAPLKFVRKESGWCVRFSRAWSYYGYFIVTIIIVTTASSLISDLQLPPEESVRMTTSTRRVVWIVDVVCMLIIAGTSVVGAPAQMRAMIICINRIEKINFEMNTRLWAMHSETKKTRYFFLWIAAAITLTVVDFMRCTEIKETKIWIDVMYSSYYFCYWILQLRELNFVMLTLRVMYCLRSVNDSLKKLLSELTDINDLPLMTLFNSNFSRASKNTLFKVNVNIIADAKKPRPGVQKTTNHHETVRRLAIAYANTCDVVRDVDNSHGLIVLMMLGSFLFHLVCTPYYVITSLFKESYDLDVDWTSHSIYIGVQLVWCFYHAVNLLMLIEPCHLTQIEMENTCELVSHLMRCTTSIHDPLAMELEMFFKHIFLNQASYSAMHVTTISRSLVATILGSITTYLVIIIQL